MTGDTGSPLRHNAAARAAPRSGHSAARHCAVLVFHPDGDACLVTTSAAASMALERADPAACPGRRYEQGQPAAWREQDGEELAERDAGIC